MVENGTIHSDFGRGKTLALTFKPHFLPFFMYIYIIYLFFCIHIQYMYIDICHVDAICSVFVYKEFQNVRKGEDWKRGKVRGTYLTMHRLHVVPQHPLMAKANSQGLPSTECKKQLKS